MSICYDRRADRGLLDALGSWANSLVKFGKARSFALDLQLRGYAKRSNRTWATLYVGLTKVLDLSYQDNKGFRLSAHASYMRPNFGWNASWEKWQAADQLQGHWRAVDLYLERVIPSIGNRFLKEGSVQSAVAGFESRDIFVIDREAAVTYANADEKRRITSRLQGNLFKALGDQGPERWWKSRPAALGGECDALALDGSGTLLAIEIKPRAASTIRWSPLQVRHYADLFAEWIDTATAPDPLEVLTGMIKQRQELGLIGDDCPVVRTPIRVQPVIAIGRGYSEDAINDLRQVQARLTECNDPPLRVMEAALWGELTEVGLTA